MRVLLVAGVLSGTRSIGESESVVVVRHVCAGTTRRYCSRKLCSSDDWGIATDERAGAHQLPGSWIGLRMKPPIGYGSGVSASRHHDLPRQDRSYVRTSEYERCG